MGDRAVGSGRPRSGAGARPVVVPAGRGGSDGRATGLLARVHGVVSGRVIVPPPAGGCRLGVALRRSPGADGADRAVDG
jgi:hypothetical protein